MIAIGACVVQASDVSLLCIVPAFVLLSLSRAGLGVLGAAWAHSAAQATSLLLMIAYCIKHTRGQPEGK